MLGFDPLKIFYVLVFESADQYDVTPFQGFSNGWADLRWALNRIVTAPADVLERSYPIEPVNAQRIGNMRPLYWLPLDINSLEEISTEDIGIFVVCFSGKETISRRVDVWSETQRLPILHVSYDGKNASCDISDFNDERLRDYCRLAFDVSSCTLSEDRRYAIENALSSWLELTPKPSGLVEYRHNILLPNFMSLRRAGLDSPDGGAFIGASEKEYSDKIIESAEAVLNTRSEIGLRAFHLRSLVSPPIILAEPALYRHAYRRIGSRHRSPEEKMIDKTLRMLQTQKSLHNTAEAQYIIDIQNSAAAKLTIAMRRAELETFSLGVGLRAAQTCSAVVRLSPGVNHVFPALSSYARNVRSTKFAERLKAKRLFDVIQAQLVAAVGPERLDFIARNAGPLKIVSDAPIEWLPIDGLPLSLRYDCSRINATPGNLLMAGLVTAPPLTLAPGDLQKILVLTCFAPSDPLRDVLTKALQLTRDDWEGKAEIIFAKATNKREFVEAINAFDGGILIFDGHGTDNSDELVGKLLIGSDAIDVWELRREVKVPPIAILSACDTHGIDASSHATVGNGFLVLGTRAVLATLLPVGGLSSAAFIARLILRITVFLPAALASFGRALNWAETISGMLRMLFASELLDQLVGPPVLEGTPRLEIAERANYDINSGDEDWYKNLLIRIAEHLELSEEKTREKAKAALARCEAIRYVQLGNPETIIIDDGSIEDQVRQHYSSERAG